MASSNPSMINILVTSFPGLGLPATLSIPVAASTPVSDVVLQINERLPTAARLILTTTSNRQLSPLSNAPIASLSDNGSLLPLRLSARLCGGKGGFGSQLRAAGGRMASRKKKANKDDGNGSYRTLEGRRVHTVNYARKLAEQLEVRPEMERREKEEKRKRWEQVVESSDRKIEELKSGAGKARLDGKWVEGYEEAVKKTREAVLAAAALAGESNESGSGSAGSQGSESEEVEGSGTSEKRREKVAAPVKFFGWDDDEEDSSEDESEEDESEIGDEDEDEEGGDEAEETSVQAHGEGKGKAKA